MYKSIFLLLCVFLSHANVSAQKNYIKYVDPFIGTGGHGHTYPGATLPHGMVQLSPDTRLDGWDGCGGYHYSDSFIYGFSHTHLSGTGVSDFGDILVMPMNGKASPNNKIYGSLFSHEKEKASAGYYSVKLDDDDIEAEFTASERVGFHHYRFSVATDNNIILDLKHRDEVIASSLKIEDSVTVSGMRRSKAWADNQYVYFVMKFSRPIKDFGIWKNDTLLPGRVNSFENAKNLKAFFQFDLIASNDIYIKVAISPVSVEGAKKNMAAEINNWDFTAAKKKAENKWNSELSKIEVVGNDENKLIIFYTALYHTAIVPNVNMDVDAQYRGRDNKIHTADGFTYYSVFSLWDTYRAAHPLYTIIDTKRTLDYIKTFLMQFQQGGRLPVWELAGCETDCMIGYHSVPVIVDAYIKGISGFDTQLALAAMKKSANWDHLGLPAYIKNGVIETGDESESVSKSLEYAYDDWCIAMFADRIGNKKDYLDFIQRAQYYKNTFDVKTGFMRPRKNGDWLNPFDPREVNNNFTEANSWQYSFYMPQDIGGYIKKAGGFKKMETKLDSLFATSSKTTGRDQSDITGLIGQYAHGNEPSHHIIYLYNYTTKPYKTQELVHKVMSELYRNAPDGLIGNEDCGQMSAWYVLSALGFYPVTPGSAVYEIGTPLFPSATIHLENGKSFRINAPEVSDLNFYVQKASIQKNIFNKSPGNLILTASLKHASVLAGGTLNFTMGNMPSGFFSEHEFPGEIKNTKKDDIEIITNPVIHGGPVPFKSSKQVSITSDQGNIKLYYTLDGSIPTEKSTQYSLPIIIDRSLILKAIALNAVGKYSFVTTAEYKKLPHSWTVQLNTAYEQQYDAGGADALVDGIRGTINWHMGNWQGYQKADVDVVIDLNETRSVSKVTAGFLQDTKAWIVMPKEFIVETAVDGKNFTRVYKGEKYLPIDDLNAQLKNIEASFSPIPARYIRIKAIQYGKLPSWHEGAGGDTHIFIDEIEIQ